MKKALTATEMRMNLRQIHSQVLLHLIFDTIRPHIRDDEQGRSYDREKQIFNDLSKLLESHGAEIITDQIREEAGLPARGPDGWTMEELHALEKRRLELLTAPVRVPFDDERA